ncbi:MAG: hypothetical protein ACREXO_14605 [Advenella sp.]
MVTRKSSPIEQSTIEVRIIDFKLTGSDEALRESLLTISNAFGRQNVQANRTLPAARASQIQGPSNNSVIDAETHDEAEAEDDVQEITSRPVSKGPRRVVKTPTVKVLDGINFTDTDPTLKDFYESKNPTSDLSRYLVVAYWYKNTRGIADLTPDHFHTAFRALKVATPKNALQPIRELRSSRNGKFTAGETKGTSTIHHIGETFVEEMGKGG